MSKISESTIKRLSLYLRILEGCRKKKQATISSGELAHSSGATSAQVRKDLSLFGSFGKRGLGYPVADLAERIGRILGLEREYRIVLVGAGKLGSALVQYHGFGEHGFTVVAAYDNDVARHGKSLNGVPVLAYERLAADLQSNPADIAILTTPSEAAQGIADTLVSHGILAILNFTNAKLDVPATVAVKDVNMAMELEALSFAIRNQG